MRDLRSDIQQQHHTGYRQLLILIVQCGYGDHFVRNALKRALAPIAEYRAEPWIENLIEYGYNAAHLWGGPCDWQQLLDTTLDNVIAHRDAVLELQYSSRQPEASAVAA